MITVRVPEALLRKFDNDVHAGCQLLHRFKEAGIPIRGCISPLYLERGVLTHRVVVEVDEDTFQEVTFYQYEWSEA